MLRWMRPPKFSNKPKDGGVLSKLELLRIAFLFKTICRY